MDHTPDLPPVSPTPASEDYSVLDTDLARDLEISLSEIHRVVDRYAGELESWGALQPAPANVEAVSRYLFNAPQAELICLLAEGAQAAEFRAEVVTERVVQGLLLFGDKLAVQP